MDDTIKTNSVKSVLAKEGLKRARELKLV